MVPLPLNRWGNNRYDLSGWRGSRHQPGGCSDLNVSLSEGSEQRANPRLFLKFAQKPGKGGLTDRRRVYLYIQFRNGWQCQFRQENLKTSLPRKLRFASSDKVVELIKRGGGITDQ